MKYYYDNVTDVTMASVKFAQNNEIVSRIVQEDGKYVVYKYVDYVGEESEEEMLTEAIAEEVVEAKPKRKYNKKYKKDAE